MNHPTEQITDKQFKGYCFGVMCRFGLAFLSKSDIKFLREQYDKKQKELKNEKQKTNTR